MKLLKRGGAAEGRTGGKVGIDRSFLGSVLHLEACMTEFVSTGGTGGAAGAIFCGRCSWLGRKAGGRGSTLNKIINAILLFLPPVFMS